MAVRTVVPEAADSRFDRTSMGNGREMISLEEERFERSAIAGLSICGFESWTGCRSAARATVSAPGARTIPPTRMAPATVSPHIIEGASIRLLLPVFLFLRLSSLLSIVSTDEAKIHGM